MNNLTSADSISAVFMESEEFRDSPLCPLFTLCSIYAGDAISSDDLSGEKAIPVYGSNGIRSYADKANHLEDQVLVGRQGSVGTVHFAEAPFWAAEHALIVEPRTPRVSKSWLKYVLEAIDLSRLSRAVAQPGINATSVSFQRVPHIPFEQQKVIGDYLDRETAEIDAAVADLDKYVELLNVKLESASREVFTELSANHPLIQTKFLVDITTGSGDTQDSQENGGFPFYVRSDTIQRAEDFEFDCEAVLTSGDGAGVGKIFHLAGGKFKAHQRVYVMHNFKRVSPQYFYWMFKSAFPDAIRYGGAKSTVDSVRRPMIANLKIPVPDHDAQEKASKRIEKLHHEVSTLIAKSTKLRDLLLKRRSVLITEVVTGRKQV